MWSAWHENCELPKTIIWFASMQFSKFDSVNQLGMTMVYCEFKHNDQICYDVQVCQANLLDFIVLLNWWSRNFPETVVEFRLWWGVMVEILKLVLSRIGFRLISDFNWHVSMLAVIIFFKFEFVHSLSWCDSSAVGPPSCQGGKIIKSGPVYCCRLPTLFCLLPQSTRSSWSQIRSAGSQA